MSKSTTTVRIRREDLKAARIIATGTLDRNPHNDAEALSVLVALSCEEAHERLAERISHEMRCAIVATAINVGGLAGADYRFDPRSGWFLVWPDGTEFPLGHANVGGVIEALERSGVTLGDHERTEDQ